ncbi:MAG: hypothetical protein IJR14_00415 [Synergistaceae bacterium]|nr:hypothetical protein [Synergistaceae bacterium]
MSSIGTLYDARREIKEELWKRLPISQIKTLEAKLADIEKRIAEHEQADDAQASLF